MLLKVSEVHSLTLCFWCCELSLTVFDEKESGKGLGDGNNVEKTLWIIKFDFFSIA